MTEYTMNNEAVKQIEFNDKDLAVLLSLRKVIEGFIIFFFVLTVLYPVLAVFLFINGNTTLHISPQSFASFVPILIALVSQYLARELYNVKKSLNSLLDKDNTGMQESIGNIFRRMKRFFVMGAFFLFAFITGFMFVMIMLIFKM